MRPKLRHLFQTLATKVYNRIVKNLPTRLQGIHANPYITGKLFPLGGDATDFVIDRAPTAEGGLSNTNLPVPPAALWEGYGSSVEEYLESSRKDIDTMLRIISDSGGAAESLTKVMDLGCAAGRMLRSYPYIAGKSELWGCDINATYINWCQQHLSPQMLFATTTTAPHLPFEDNYFDLIYCGSVFTHISDLADAWFLELRRVIRKGGYAYITIHDKHTLDLLFTKYQDRPDFGYFVDLIRRFVKKTNLNKRDYAFFSVLADPQSQVFYDIEYLKKKWSQFADIVSITPEAHDHQTAVLLRKR